MVEKEEGALGDRHPAETLIGLVESSELLTTPALLLGNEVGLVKVADLSDLVEETNEQDRLRRGTHAEAIIEPLHSLRDGDRLLDETARLAAWAVISRFSWTHQDPLREITDHSVDPVTVVGDLLSQLCVGGPEFGKLSFVHHD